MSNEFALPVAVDLLPRAPITALIIALHCLPLIIVLSSSLPPALAWSLAAFVIAHLGWRLHCQRIACGMTRLEANVNGWQLRGTDSNKVQKIDRIDSLDLKRIILLRATRGKRSFHLAVRATCGGKSHEQLHRLRVLLRAPPQS